MNIEDLIKIIACPQCKCKCAWAHEKNIITCHKCKSAFKIIDNTPVMLLSLDKKEIYDELYLKKNSQIKYEWDEKKLNLKGKVWNKIKPPKPWIDIDKDKIIDPLFNINAMNLEIGTGITKRKSKSIGMDINQWGNVDIIGIGENIPFQNNTFDFVFC